VSISRSTPRRPDLLYRTTLRESVLKRLPLLTVLFLLGLAGCGDDDKKGGGEAAIVVERPEPDTTVSSPVTISGTASVFEGTVQLRILDAEGREIASAFTTASVGEPGRGDFSQEVEFTVDEAQDGVVKVFEENMASPEESPERELSTVEVPVHLEP
jgi:hypothetical protein